MTKFNLPERAELPTSHQLNRATLLAIGVAGAILVTTILPAEYGIDPTGIGGVLGLTPMGEMKRAAAAAPEAVADSGDIIMDAAPSTPSAATPATAASQTAEVRLTLQPNEGSEVKATMKAGGEFDYVWSTNGAQVNFELHGEPFGAASDEYTTYEKGTSAGADGKFRAPFDGTHGWYWRNRTGTPLTITVKATGVFEKFVQLE